MTGRDRRPGEADLVSAVRARLRALPGARPTVRFLRRLAPRLEAYTWYQWDVGDVGGVAERLARSDCDFRIGTEADLDNMAKRDTWRDVSLYRAWMDQGAKLLLAVKDGAIASYAFLKLGRTCATEQIPELTLTLARDGCFADEAYTLRAYRGQGIHRLVFLYEILIAQGSGRQFIVTYYLGRRHYENAVRSRSRLGVAPATPLCTAKRLHALGVQHAWLSWSRPLPARTGLIPPD